MCFRLAVCAEDVPGTTEQSPEDFKIEATGSLWIVDSAGNVGANGTMLDFVHDLGTRQQAKIGFGTFIFKPGQRHRIVVDFMSLGFSGQHQITESFTYANQRYHANELVDASARAKYLYGGYQYDFITGSPGHLGASVGAVYFHSQGTLSAPQAGVNTSDSGNFGFPLAGLEFRVFPVPGRAIVDLNGGIRGMDFGNYGHYLESGLNAGIWMGRHLGLHVGYKDIRAAFQNTGGSSANAARADVRIHGPVFSLTFK